MNLNREPFFGWNPPVFSAQIAASVSFGIRKMYNLDQVDEIPLTAVDSSIHKGLKLIHRGEGPKVGKGLIVGSVRMGYGHHRMALSAFSHSIAKKIPTYLHDLLAIDSPESRAIGDVDGVYSYFSRLSSDMGGPMEWAWGNITNSGNASSLYLSTVLAKEYKKLMNDIPHDNPVITTYPLNGQIAVEAGFKNVVHLICDNHPQHYLLVPGALNLVQTEHNLKGFLKMGVPRENLELVGHWISEDILRNVTEDSDIRIKRTRNRSPKRFLIPIGGAGAQKNYLTSLIELSADRLKEGEFKFFINAGDHEHVYKHLVETLERKEIEYESIRSWNDLKEFVAKNKLSDKEDSKLKPVALFHFLTHSEGFSATDVLIRISDVMVTKPSELAFFPIPKVFIRRVGDHEEKSALYSLDLGEGSVECREASHAYDIMLLFVKSPEVSLRMNECVISNAQKGIYNGSKKAVEIAMNLKS
ncbi:DUF6938 domain-containing protein [Leptospira sp. GIMC2001]|uniref:DUF6938 domain-containing protein n=1 Tax=Leptospira sp. GIMC2001 TaxID=1513297 RepID=UPI00234A9CDB|nr:hypothetical protein [Leptospira sp. GIMC2001]WCL50247.1 hypothetical protein O4O04_05345 [Leptospira sp. GIMC2001]